MWTDCASLVYLDEYEEVQQQDEQTLELPLDFSETQHECMGFYVFAVENIAIYNGDLK